MGIYESVNHLFPDNLANENALKDLVCAGFQQNWPHLCCRPSNPDLRDDAWRKLSYSKLDHPLGLPTETIKENFALSLGEIKRNVSEAITQSTVYRELNVNAQNDKLLRLGLPLHYRLWCDVTSSDSDKGNAADPCNPCWDSGANTIANLWIKECGVGLDLAEAYWMWRHILSQDPDKRTEPVTTRLVAVNSSKKTDMDIPSFTGQLSVSLVDWTQHQILGVTPPKSGFVRNPKSFAYCLDTPFSDSFVSTKNYLSNQEIWRNTNWVVEWDIQLGPPGAPIGVPTLTGGSAGAAIALATGSLLARELLKAA